MHFTPRINIRPLRRGTLALVVTGSIGFSQAGTASAPIVAAEKSFPATYTTTPATQLASATGFQTQAGSYQAIAWYKNKHWWKKNAPIIGGAGGGAVVGGLLGGGTGAIVGGAIGGGGGYAYKRLKHHHNQQNHSHNYNHQSYHHQ